MYSASSGGTAEYPPLAGGKPPAVPLRAQDGLALGHATPFALVTVRQLRSPVEGVWDEVDEAGVVAADVAAPRGHDGSGGGAVRVQGVLDLEKRSLGSGQLLAHEAVPNHPPTHRPSPVSTRTQHEGRPRCAWSHAVRVGS